jgi:hypothetical protein
MVQDHNARFCKTYMWELLRSRYSLLIEQVQNSDGTNQIWTSASGRSTSNSGDSRNHTEQNQIPYLRREERDRGDGLHLIQQRQKNQLLLPSSAVTLFLLSLPWFLHRRPPFLPGRPAGDLCSLPCTGGLPLRSSSPLSSRAPPSPELLPTVQSPAAAISPRSRAEGRHGPSILRRGAASAPSPSWPAEVASIRPAASSGGGSSGPPPSPARARAGLGAVWGRAASGAVEERIRVGAIKP